MERDRKGTVLEGDAYPILNTLKINFGSFVMKTTSQKGKYDKTKCSCHRHNNWEL